MSAESSSCYNNSRDTNLHRSDPAHKSDQRRGFVRPPSEQIPFQTDDEVHFDERRTCGVVVTRGRDALMPTQRLECRLPYPSGVVVGGRRLWWEFRLQRKRS